ncbi:PRD domain-containing protein [Enterococcus sp. BWB1-3]|uniref:BglG family transcription antiterminator LicT n=1 Tax=unclassified Enterococcus TaxID=2608891 RepID=UPI001922CFF8|nr:MULTISPECIES: PRD domain-containing protein [unclassified Enterococcus]MBL1227639.1 PRD domain-containing protein [Enterococcus sp. BWB1-3]MCB5954417.1 PRD domain-containing protein [Enterococcus sp. CWB-B31]
MLVHKILNNNVIITADDRGHELIVMGKGLGFQKKPGDFISKDYVDKIYQLKNETNSLRFQELLADIPLEYLEISDEIIEYAKKEINESLNETIYISLTDHLHTAIERVKKNVEVKNVLLWDIKRFFSDEFKVGMEAIEKVKERYDIQLSEDEAGFIALHIVNAQQDGESPGNTYEITKIMQEIMNIIKYYFKISFDETSVYFYRFTTHLKFFAYRLTTKKQYLEETDNELLDVIKVKYKNAYSCVNTIGTYLQDTYNYTISNDEKLYLTIHIARLVSKNS